MKRTLILLILTCLGFNLASAQTKQIKRLQNQKAALQKELSASQKLLTTTKRDVKSQLNNLAVLNNQIGEQKKYVDGIQSEVLVLSNNLSVLERQLQALEADLALCKKRYEHGVIYFFNHRMSLNKWLFVLKAKDFREMSRRLRYVSEYTRYQQMQAKIIKEKEAAVQQKKNEILGVKATKDKLLVEGQQQQRQLNEKHVKQKQVVDDLNKKQRQLQATIAQQQRKYANLNARIDQLIRAEIAKAEARRKAEAARKAAEAKRRAQEAARKAAEAKRRAQEAAARKAAAEKAARQRAAAEKARLAKIAAQKAAAAERAAKQKAAQARTAAAKAEARRAQEAARRQQQAAARQQQQAAAEARNAARTPAAPVFRAESAADNALSGGFAANRGRLPVPITGSYAITAHYGTYNVAGLRGVQLSNKGINLTGRPGAQARAVYSGEVTAVFNMNGLYNVIVRHGSYMSVYCNLSSVSVHRGQQVGTRQTLGSVAGDGTGNCTLHFQLRRETSPLNPEAWIGR